MDIQSLKNRAREFLSRINELNQKYNAILYVLDEEAIFKQIDSLDTKNKNSPIFGKFFTVKDSFVTIDAPTTAGDKYLEGFISPYDATVVQRLLDAGAILIGKTNMDSWGFGGSTENSAYGPTRNPFDVERVAGGSSGGSACAVALDFCDFSIGEDTGGSIRNPAAYCGIYGYKPTYGMISRYGCIAYASSLDTVGVFSKDINLMRDVIGVIRGSDSKDMTIDETLFDIKFDVKKTFAYSEDLIPDGTNTELRNEYLNFIEKLKTLGYNAINVKFDFFDISVPVYYITAMSEASTNLARYHGTRYGRYWQSLVEKLDKNSHLSWEDIFFDSRTEGFGDEAKRRITLGSYVLSEGYYDAYYKKAQEIRNYIRSTYEKIFQDADFVLSPVTPGPAPRIGEKVTDPVAAYMDDIYTVTVNLAGLPAIAFPVTKYENGLPMGLQLIGPKGSDLELINILSNLNL
ncbi:MAG: Asp-tRNA(Asn)/Glu-tRNA(Gln) amidotransferase subunit GatA [Candidatus Dojkabacteria bacterium]|nr:Asp-tRNA(Asn)/Glu-tRNA(Gln) amidotransferase subunit GatA [Candidatus Dojkabacteria bacterium]